LDSPQWNSRRRRTLCLFKTPGEYRTTLSVILRHAKALYLVDPYMNCEESRFLDTIDMCSAVMGRRIDVPYRGRIRIHAELKWQRPTSSPLGHIQSRWEDRLKTLVSRDGHRFEVFLWEALPQRQGLHDRYILTDQCGISVPGGLDCRTHSAAGSTDWSLLDEDVRRLRLQDYDASTTAFTLAARQSVP
jgi:hypothetical protein